MNTETIIVSGIVGIATSAITAYITTRLKMSEERKKWDRELTLKYAEATIASHKTAEVLATQFAVGLLIVQQPDGQRDKVFIPKGGRLTIGRSPDRSQVVLRDEFVSGVAAAIEAEGASVFVRDLNHTNGTFLNDTKLCVGSRQRLKSGDVIKLGRSKLMFQEMKGID